MTFIANETRTQRYVTRWDTLTCHWEVIDGRRVVYASLSRTDTAMWRALRTQRTITPNERK